MCELHAEKQRLSSRRAWERAVADRGAPPFRERRDGFLRNTYGISLVEYERLHEAQGGVCAICRQPETHVKRGSVVNLSVDHDHDSGRVRGLLCNNCNRGLGFLRDDPSIVLSAAQYLTTAKGLIT